MKKTPLLNAELSHIIATMGHGQMLVLGDAGLPVPPGVRCVDLALTPGVPTIWQVLDAVLSELCVEDAVIASEADPVLAAVFAERTKVRDISHADFKALSATAVAVVRTGETTPYANIALISGVVF